MTERDIGVRMKLQGLEVLKTEGFKYLGSTIQNNGQCTREVKESELELSELRFSLH